MTETTTLDDGLVPETRSRDDVEYDFYGRIDELVSGLDLPEQVFESSCEVCDGIRGVEDYKYSFTSFGGFDALVAVSVFVGAKQVRVPLLGERVMGFVGGSEVFSVSRSFSAKKLRRVSRKFRRELDLEPVFLQPSDFIDFYVGRLEFPVNQDGLKGSMFVSHVAVRYTYKEIVEELTGVETFNRELEDLSVTPASFGFYGDGVEEFSRFLLERVEEENLDVLSKSPQVLAAACMYIAGKLLKG